VTQLAVDLNGDPRLGQGDIDEAGSACEPDLVLGDPSRDPGMAQDPVH
jgi:hypothetical protein